MLASGPSSLSAGLTLTVSMKMLPVPGILREKPKTRIRWDLRDTALVVRALCHFRSRFLGAVRPFYRFQTSFPVTIGQFLYLFANSVILADGLRGYPRLLPTRPFPFRGFRRRRASCAHGQRSAFGDGSGTLTLPVVAFVQSAQKRALRSSSLIFRSPDS